MTCHECKRNTTLRLKVDVRDPVTQGWKVRILGYCNRCESKVRAAAFQMGHIKP